MIMFHAEGRINCEGHFLMVKAVRLWGMVVSSPRIVYLKSNWILLLSYVLHKRITLLLSDIKQKLQLNMCGNFMLILFSIFLTTIKILKPSRQWTDLHKWQKDRGKKDGKKTFLPDIWRMFCSPIKHHYQNTWEVNHIPGKRRFPASLSGGRGVGDVLQRVCRVSPFPVFECHTGVSLDFADSCGWECWECFI